MPAPKGNKNAVGNSGGGRPSLYKPQYAEMARKIALLGATDAELAEILDVSQTTLNKWKHEHVEFYDALKKGKTLADAEVTDRLYQRAMGYEHPDTDIRVIDHTIVKTKIRKYYPPDTTAAIFWLKNRRPDQWRDKQDIDQNLKHSGTIERIERVVVDPKQE